MTDMILWEGTPAAVPAFRILAIIDGDIHAGKTRDTLSAIYQRYEASYGKAGGDVSYNFPGHRGRIRKATAKLLGEAENFFRQEETLYGQGIRRYGYALKAFPHPGIPFFGVEQRSDFHFLDIALPEDASSIIEFADFVAAELMAAPVITGVMGMGFFLPYHNSSLAFLLGAAAVRYRAAIEVTPGMVDAGIRSESSPYRWQPGEQPGIADIGWRTLVGAEFWGRLPDIAQLREDANIRVEKSSTVLCVTAGEAPIWGDIESGEDFGAHKTVARYFAPVRLPEGYMRNFGLAVASQRATTTRSRPICGASTNLRQLPHSATLAGRSPVEALTNRTARALFAPIFQVVGRAASCARNRPFQSISPG